MTKKKILKRMCIAMLMLSLTSCVYVVDNTPGPPGRPGMAFFGVGFDYSAPYSYWDENPSIPVNPILNRYYPTAPGTYYFEYFVSPVEYWYGTYDIYINPGGPGGPHGEPGLDGVDTYLMMVCNPGGPYEWGNGARMENGKVIIEKAEGASHYRIEMQKASTAERPARMPVNTYKR